MIHHSVHDGYILHLEIGALPAFLPGSHADIKPVIDYNNLINQKSEFKILEIDRQQENIIVSRRLALQEIKLEEQRKIFEQFKEGMILEGVVKKIVDYAAFITLGESDGLLHISNLSPSKFIQHPSEILETGQSLKVHIISLDHEKSAFLLEGYKLSHSK